MVYHLVLNTFIFCYLLVSGCPLFSYYLFLFVYHLFYTYDNNMVVLLYEVEKYSNNKLI